MSMRIIHDRTKIYGIMEDQNNAASWSRNRPCEDISNSTLPYVDFEGATAHARRRCRFVRHLCVRLLVVAWGCDHA